MPKSMPALPSIPDLVKALTDNTQAIIDSEARLAVRIDQVRELLTTSQYNELAEDQYKLRREMDFRFDDLDGRVKHIEGFLGDVLKAHGLNSIEQGKP